LRIHCLLPAQRSNPAGHFHDSEEQWLQWFIIYYNHPYSQHTDKNKKQIITSVNIENFSTHIQPKTVKIDVMREF